MLALAGFLGLLAACDVYDSSLLTGGSSAGGSPSNGGGPSNGGQGEGGMASCTTPDQCPGVDSECGTRTCDNGTCDVDAAAAGTPAEAQTAGDCIHNECDGSGNIVGVADDGDLPVDDNDCTGDLCTDGVPSNPPVGVGDPCNDNGGAHCNADGNCVECVTGAHCASTVCTDRFTCAPASCNDGAINGNETDLNCGGGDCPACMIGQNCDFDSDCLSNSCGALGECEASCVDGMMNQDETDVDCGGLFCDACGFGEGCQIGLDCETGSCSASDTCTCAPNNGVVIISEVRSRGPGGAGDDFVELYNPGSTPVTLSSSWTVVSRSETAGTYDTRFVGSGQVVPPSEHFLIAGTAYTGAAAADAPFVSGLADEVSVLVKNGTTVVDAVCYQCGTNNFSDHTCEGAVFTLVGCANNINRSIERKPGGALGNCIDTQDSSMDFAEITPSNPQNLASPPTP
ncbi:MAG: lamin tail domain-containing protein [Polyangiaceae bacterium]|nr:lamin tail domain-containing protein [Polyangiaceae bacterium]